MSGTCLLCFSANIKIFDIKGTPLKSVYEELSENKIQNDSHRLCHICRARLHQCYLLVEQFHNLHKSPQNASNQVEHKSLVQLSTINIENTAIPYQCVLIKQKLDVKEENSDCNKNTSIPYHCVAIKQELDIKEQTSDYNVNTPIPYDCVAVKQEPDVKGENSDYVENNRDDFKCETVKEPDTSYSYRSELKQDKSIHTADIQLTAGQGRGRRGRRSAARKRGGRRGGRGRPPADASLPAFMAGDASGRSTSHPYGIFNESQIENIPNYGSDVEEESGSEDEAFPTFVPRTERMFLLPIDPSDEWEPLQSPALSTPAAAQEEDSNLLHSVPAGPERCRFNWKSFPETPISPQTRREVFTGVAGPTVSFPSPKDAFTAIWDEEILNSIVTETNRYAREEIAKAALAPHSRWNGWTATYVSELFVYFGLLLTMGICIKSSVKEYWSNYGLPADTPDFNKFMGFNRFVMLNKFLHFVDNACDISALSPGEAKIHKIKPIVNHLNHKFQTLYNLGRNISIDESLTLWKGLSTHQFTKNKAASIGVKTYELCDAKTGYLWRFEIHSGNKENTTEPLTPMSGNVPTLVFRLLQGLENRGHCLWMDSFCNTPALARILKLMGFDCVGILRTNRKLLPPQLASLKKGSMAIGELQGCTSGDVDILVWGDRNKVAMISTYHGQAVQHTQDAVKPAVVTDYYLCMGGVDRKDQLLAMYPMEWKRTRVRYKKLFMRLLNVSVLNSYILYNSLTTYSVPRLFTSHRRFILELSRQLLNNRPQPIISTVTLSGQFCEEYFKHLPKEHSSRPGRGNEKYRKVCVVCKKLSRYYCPGCGVTLCVVGCFGTYHE